MSKLPQEIVEGLAVSPGAAFGRAVCIASQEFEIYRLSVADGEVDAELERLSQAVEVAQQDLDSARDSASAEIAGELGGIFEAHSLLLSDPGFLGRIQTQIRTDRVNAEWAVHETATDLAERFRRLDAEHLRARGEDLIDVSRHLQRALGGLSHQDLSEIEGDFIVVAHDLTPSEAVRLGRERVIAFAIETGSRTSHTTIIARSLHIPMVAGLAGLTHKVTDDDPLIVDGDNGRVILHPEGEAREGYRAAETRRRARWHRGVRSRTVPAETLDGVPVTLQANIDLPEEITEASEFGAAGVGLYRSEFIYIERSPDLPTEEEHLEIYTKMLEAMAPHPVVVRTFDLGGRKLAREVMHTAEENPVLGMRGIRLTLALPEIFAAQVRALLRAAARGPLQVMLPLVTTVEEVRAFRRLVEEAAARLEARGVEHSADFELGVMIEVPAAVWIAAELAREVSFLSIGTNDLIQYSMAVDRNNEHVSYLYQPYHPAILRMIRSVAAVGEEAGIPVSLCGEMAADPDCAPLLVALGLRILSLTPSTIPEVKEAIRSISLKELKEPVQRALAQSTAEEVVQCLRDALPSRYGPLRPPSAASD
ncbi:MAG: phosphoenolpyruvate--protein phosphotransferase [Acidobacteria bacterium]|nr:phosphoenolpyruvate--protein phosphotransferase [Acidobacteriota bacterium]